MDPFEEEEEDEDGREDGYEYRDDQSKKEDPRREDQTIRLENNGRMTKDPPKPPSH